MALVKFCALLCLTISSFVMPAPYDNHGPLAARQSSEKLVFCHFMIGTVGGRSSASDYDQDMQQAQAAGIDAFALNIGTDDYTETQLNYAYQSAANNGMSVFISFDFNWYKTSQTSDLGKLIKSYGGQSAQLKVDNKIVVSSFQGDGLDLDAVASASGFARNDLFFALNLQPQNAGSTDALFNWMAWPNNGNNKAPDAGNNFSVSDGDKTYMNALGGKPYVAPVAAWFSTHYGPEVSYSKNWVFPSDLLWFQRWTEILTLAPQFLEIITWNDYGESHYVGPLNSPHTDDGNSKWVNDMPHDGFLQMAKPYIAAYKAGSATVDNHIDSDQLIYWYRPHLKSASCDNTDTCRNPAANPSENYFTGKPNGYDSMSDSVFVVALLTSSGTVSVSSGSNSQTFSVNAGANAFQVPMGTGKQSFSLSRNGQTVLSGDSLKDISSDCICGIYNFNAYAGTLPAGASDPLQPDGLKSFAVSLDATCQATPSLGTATGAAVATATTAAASLSNSGAGSPVVSTSAISLSSSAGSIATTAAVPITASTQSPAPVQAPTTTTAAVGGGGSKTITALSQLAPSNCMHAGDVWAGPEGSDPAAYCDGG
ncbi:hypothetical protein ACLMJK_000739 [Lecanora helva]